MDFDNVLNIQEELYVKIAPYLSGMSLSDINILVGHITSDTPTEFVHWVHSTQNKSIKVFYDITGDILEPFLDANTVKY